MEHEQRITGPRGYVRSDERIHDDLCSRLAYSDRLDVHDVEVTVSGGVVALSGTVEDRWQKYCIEEIADHVLGVKDVDNRIRVTRTDCAAAQGTQQGLAGQLGRAGQTASQNVAGAEHVSGMSTSGSS
ncbi:BON domain-containing protein, partial [Cupriavidus pinatubonensis]|uniref:BON domain-containing protein n=1 Tax=Cupriavidus pinatubonensis TaxID=248026 RepID=UPI00112AE16F